MTEVIETRVASYNDKGMHPGVIDGWRQHDKVNTSKPYKSGKGKLAKTQARLLARRNSHSETLKSLPGTIPPEAFKTPGSMKGK